MAAAQSVPAESPAAAASTASPASDLAARPDDLGTEIVVTARKRGEERLQDVAASITAMGAVALERMSVESFADFAYQVPGLTFTDQGPGLKRYTIRGIQSAGQEQVAVYYDEVPVPGLQSSGGDSGSQIGDLQLYDMDRIEVLKGPQSTTFGANSQTGAIRFIAKKPDLNEVTGSVKVGANSLAHSSQYGASVYGMLNMPVVNDKLGVRLVSYFARDPGYIDNVRLGNDDINSTNTSGVRALVRFEPAPEVQIDGMVWLQKRRSNGAFDYHPFDSFHLRGDPSDQGYKDNIPSFAVFDTGEFQTGDFVKTPRPDMQEIYSLTSSVDLGGAALTVAGSVYKREYGFFRDNTWQVIAQGVGPAGATCLNNRPCVRADLLYNVTDQTQDINQKTFETRINSTGSGPFQWLAGVFYRDRESDFRSYSPIVDPRTGEPYTAGFLPTGPSTAPGAGIEGCTPCDLARINTRRIKEKAAFGEATFDITDQIELMGGLRWFEAKQADDGQTLFQFPLFGTLPPPDQRRFKEDRTIKKAQISFKPTDDLTLFALASQGFRLGGTNQSGLVAVPPGYRSDSLWNYELGLKSTWFDRRLTVNASLFQINWDDIQVSGRDPTGAFAFIGNAGKARIQGVEFEMYARPTRGIDLSGGFGWLPKRELTEDQISDEVVAPGRAGDKIPRIPAFTANATAQYSTELPVGDWNGWVRGEYSYKGKAGTELRPTAATFRTQHSYQIVNFRVGASQESSGLSVDLFLENAFDVQGEVFLSAGTAIPTAKVTNRPRTIGIEVSKTF